MPLWLLIPIIATIALVGGYLAHGVEVGQGG